MKAKRMLPGLLGPVLLLTLSCGGGGVSSESRGRVTVLLTDAPPVTVKDENGTDVFTMNELWLTITGARLEDVNGNDVPLTLAQNPLTIDILTLQSTSALLAVGSFPAGTYEELDLDVSSAIMIGDDLVIPAANQTVSLNHSGEFEAEFAFPAFLDPAQNATIVVDFVPAVEKDGGVFELEDEVEAIVLGASGGPAVQVVDDLEGTIASIDCAGNAFELAIPGGRITVDISSAQLEDDDDNAITCADMAVGDEVEVDGTIQSNGVLTATKVEDEDVQGAGGGGVGQEFEREGIVANRQSIGGGQIQFDLLVQGTPVATITTNVNTEYEDESGNIANPGAGDVQNGMRVEIEGTVSGAATPTPVLAEEVEIQ